MLQEIRQRTPDLILKLFNRRLLDKNAEITQEEFNEAKEQLDLKIKFLEFKMDGLIAKQKMLVSLINKEDLCSVSKS